jgi:hypothetical protein
MKGRKNSHGGVSAEAVIVLPVFIVTLASAMYMHSLYSAKIRAKAAARGCAWTYATMGCPDEAPAVCSEAKANIKSNGGALDQLTDLSNFEGADGAADWLAGGVATAGGIAGALLGIGDGETINTSAIAKRPSLFGGGQYPISSNYTVLCNEEHRDVLDVIKGAYCGVSSALPGC